MPCLKNPVRSLLVQASMKKEVHAEDIYPTPAKSPSNLVITLYLRPRNQVIPGSE
jgi:hypothetical protein